VIKVYRYNIETTNGTLRMYYNTLDEVQLKYPNCKITLDTDTSFVEYINKIKEIVTEILYDYRGREVWKISHNLAFILYRPYFDDGEYIDGCEYQRWDNIGYITPIGYIMSNPKRFYEEFCIKPISKPIETISLNEWKKLKTIKFYNKNNNQYSIDKDGYFYYADKTDLPIKKKIEEYNKFKGDNSVLVHYGVMGSPNTKCQWFTSLDEFYKIFKDMQQQHNPVFGDLGYNIKRKGYYKTHPNDRKTIFRLPYINISSKNINNISKEWARVMCEYRWFGNDFMKNRELAEDILNKYFEYLKGCDE